MAISGGGKPTWFSGELIRRVPHRPTIQKERKTARGLRHSTLWGKISVPIRPLSIFHPFFSFQFDHSFVEVHRVRKFRFRPRHREPASSEDLSETPKKAAFPALCSPQTSCNYRDPQSSWTCDGEILRHTAITVR